MYSCSYDNTEMPAVSSHRHLTNEISGVKDQVALELLPSVCYIRETFVMESVEIYEKSSNRIMLHREKRGPA